MPDYPTEGIERVGRFTMTVVRTEPTQESEERWSRRADALGRWLLAEWGRRHGARLEDSQPERT